jgi:hypothetical protein
MRVVLLGAGASKAYSDSPSGVRMPLSNDFFQTFEALSINRNPWVLTQHILSYVERYTSLNPLTIFHEGRDIEEFHGGIQEAFENQLKNGDRLGQVATFSAYVQMIFVFACTLNSIQNGLVSKAHQMLAAALEPDDIVLTFNWDTLLDRALSETTNWKLDNGYGVIPHRVFTDGWRSPNGTDNKAPLILKLHGSTNWLTAHPILGPSGSPVLTHDASPDTVFFFEEATKPFETYDGRYMDGFAPYSYGYYPPNLQDIEGRPAQKGHMFASFKYRFPWTPKGSSGDSGIPSIPLIIPPVKNKTYSFFGTLFKDIWQQAEDALANAEHISVVGYSFPRTDHQSNDLFKNAFSRRTTMPTISIVNPEPARIVEKFLYDFGISSGRIDVYEEYFSENFDVGKILPK